ncbi:GMC oxidoreductase [Microbacterium sp.]|uniref:GMC oxidoreductase n=1 Tax=Microbacterium sp. TaxID=51671 RepID=UPI003C77902C
MIIDSRQFTPESELAADVCVVGGGPIGISVVRELEAAGLDVIVLESGGTEADPALDREGEAAHFDFGGVRSFGNTRQLGGNANAWCVRTPETSRGVRIIPLEATDLDEKPGDPGSAWPYDYDTLVPYYARAQRFLGLPDDAAAYHAVRWADGVADQVVDDVDLRTGVFLFANAQRFLQRSLQHLSRSGSARTLINATALEVLTNHDGSVATGVRAASAPGREFVVRARFVVLAAGAVSTTQLLLASRAARPHGLGNEHDLVGRYFMDHLLLRGGRVDPVSRSDFAHRTLYDMRRVGSTSVLAHLQLTPEAIRRENLLTLSFVAFPREDAAPMNLSPRQARGIRGALRVRERLVRHRFPHGRDMAALAMGFDGALRKVASSLTRPQANLGRGGWSTRRMRDYTHFEVMHQAEQAPHPDNRITLSETPDAFGLPKVDIRVKWHDQDAEAIARAQDVFARALPRVGWGTYTPARRDGRPVVHSHSSNHFMGTTRMNASPRLGVVDGEGAVYDTPNLYVASTSVLPSGGWGNVTLTGIALALRAADSVARAARPASMAAS